MALGALLQRLQGQRKWVSGTQAVLGLLQEVGPGPADPWGTQQVCQLWYSWGPSPLGLLRPLIPRQELASSTACGQQLAEVEELLQRHDLLEAQVSARGAQVSHLATRPQS